MNCHSSIGFTPIITMTTTCTECQFSTSILTALSILLLLLVIAGIIIIILVLIIFRLYNKIQLLRYEYVHLTLSIIKIIFLFSRKTSHEDITMTTSPAYSIVKTSTK